VIELRLGPGRAEIEAAAHRIAGHVHCTPVEPSAWLSEIAGVDVFLKLECFQPTRSFKIRGAYNAVLSLEADQRSRGLVTASAGNHGQAVALAARDAGLRATIFVPANAPDTKKARIRALGAELDEESRDYDVAERNAIRYAEATGARFIHAFSDAAVVAGQGTLGLETMAQLPGVAEIIVPVGGGGLIAGVGLACRALKPDIQVTGVQSTETRGMYDAFQAGGPTEVEITPTLADGLAGGVDCDSYQRARAVATNLVLVEESLLATAIRDLFRHHGVVAEGAAAVAVAALTSGVIRPQGPAVIVVTGGNIDARRLARILAED
jgi:threonine dehydratase